MSASASLFFCRYFGIIVGDLDASDNIHWKLYKKLRAMIHFITAPSLKYSEILQLETLIREFNDMYIELFGYLLPKFHLLLHYPKKILENGPVSKSSSMRFESFHRIIKAIVLNSSSHVQILKTVGTRYLLSLMNSQFSKYEQNYVTYGSKESTDLSNDLVSSSKTKYAVKSIAINHFNYSKGTVISLNFDLNLPTFGKINNIFVVDDKIVFQYIHLRTVGFDPHYFAYSITVDETEEMKTAEYNLLSIKTPCLLFATRDSQFIAMRHAL